MAKNLGEKIVCPKCKTKFYTMGKRNASCPKCQKNDLIPDGSEVHVKLKIRPGGYNDYKLGWTDGIASEGKAGAIYLNCEFSVLSPPHSGKTIFSLIGLRSPKGSWWGNKGREFIRSILNSSHNLEPENRTPEAVNLRRLKSLKELDGVVFNAKVKAIKGDDGRWKNEIDTAVLSESDSDSVTPATKSKYLRTEKADTYDVSEAVHAASDVQPMWMR